MQALRILPVALAFSLSGCVTFYKEDQHGRPMFGASGDDAGFRQIRPDGSMTEVWSGTNSTGQKHMKDMLLGGLTRIELGRTARAITAADVEKARVGSNVRRVTELGSLRNEVEVVRAQQEGETARAAIEAAAE